MQHRGGVMVVGGCCAGPIGPTWLPQQGASFIIKQDNELKHTSRLCQGYSGHHLNKMMKRISRTGAAGVKAKGGSKESQIKNMLYIYSSQFIIYYLLSCVPLEFGCLQGETTLPGT